MKTSDNLTQQQGVDLTQYVGRTCRKTGEGATGKPFKSGRLINTIRGVINHPQLDIPAFTFVEDDSYVEARRCEII